MTQIEKKVDLLDDTLKYITDLKNYAERNDEHKKQFIYLSFAYISSYIGKENKEMTPLCEQYRKNSDFVKLITSQEEKYSVFKCLHYFCTSVFYYNLVLKPKVAEKKEEYFNEMLKSAKELASYYSVMNKKKIINYKIKNMIVDFLILVDGIRKANLINKKT